MRSFLLLSIAILTTACSQLSVQVDVLDPVAVHSVIEESKLRVLYYKIARSSSDTVNKEVTALRAKHREINLQLANIYRKLANSESNDELKDILLNSAIDIEESTEPGRILFTLYEDLKTKIWSANQKIIDLAINYPLVQNEPIPTQLREALMKRKNYVQNLKRPILDTLEAVKQDIRHHTASLSLLEKEVLGELVKDVTKPIEKALTTIIGGPTLVGSSFAYPVAVAPEHNWATKFNHAAGRGFLGDSDIVIKLNSQGDFTVKGMQFDPSTVAAIASKVTTQSLLLAAQIAGVPVTSTVVDDPNLKSPGVTATGNDVINIDQKLTERDAKIKAWQSAVRDLAGAVLSEEDSIRNGTQTDRAATGKAIGAVYDAYKDTLKLSNLN